MPSGFLPIESIPDTLEAHLHRHSRRSMAIYMAVVILVAALIGLLPLIRVSVSIQANGAIRPAIDKHEIVAGVSGFVRHVVLRENEIVERGAALLLLTSELNEFRKTSLDAQLREVEASVRDLEALVGVAGPGTSPWADPSTGRYRAELNLFLQQRADVALRRESAERELERTLHLVTVGLAPRSEGEDRQLAVDRLIAEQAAIESRYAGDWQSRLEGLTTRRRDLLEARRMLEADDALFTVRAPIAGTLEEMASVSPGSFVRAGELLAVVSPSTELVAEVFVPSADVGLIYSGMPARLLVDAFNHFDWGYLTGTVTGLAADHVIMDGAPMFRTLITMDSDYLQLGNGIRRQVRKGMTLRARFLVAERSLWQLLRDDINDWLNPIQQPV